MFVVPEIFRSLKYILLIIYMLIWIIGISGNITKVVAGLPSFTDSDTRCSTASLLR